MADISKIKLPNSEIVYDVKDTTARSVANSKSTVSVSSTGTATDEIQYITIDGTEKKIAGGGGGGGGTAHIL